ncbi:deoxyribodipyrimidine photo-lyase [Mumia flava]|uniref:Deoxyribodipyrimidine photo-lyase n=1 Tax=Mumia flava TaxID=1348852 RepID=A0A0B2B7R8_9ACTN|nr:deoxyribodipyrimidine photo-lyase [Mumia flava]PJJ56816.1 deoxyribodipyrimidine photo-lyase [Mumia flava]
MKSASVVWFRRDLRLADHPALLAARDEADEVVALVVLDPRLLARPTARRDRWLASVAALRDACGGALVVREGDPATVVPAVAAEVGSEHVHVTGESTPYGRRRDDAVRDALRAESRDLVVTGSPYAVGPGRVTTQAGTPARVFSAYARAWREHGWPAPATSPRKVRWRRGLASDPLPRPSTDVGEVGERAALRRWHAFRDERLADYADQRDRPDLDTTSRLSIPLKYGEIHPRTLLADLADVSRGGAAEATRRFTDELAWREFYADVLHHHPRSAWSDLRDDLPLDYVGEGGDALEAWRAGRTGFPFVDAGMRQLRAEGWMHNRVRMVTASFLVKDLHVWWPHGARHFLDLLLDGDVASNNHGWQWVAGTGTDAAPYVRVFNPVLQGRRFDPDGEYVRRWVPELRDLPGASVHEPWRVPEAASDYPEPIVDHDTERREALARFAVARDRTAART